MKTGLTTKERKERKGVKAQIPTYDELRLALNASVKLQAHYAKLLNMYDGGKRMIFPTTDLWLARIRETRPTLEK